LGFAKVIAGMISSSMSVTPTVVTVSFTTARGQRLAAHFTEHCVR
jgi:hypothetical protein